MVEKALTEEAKFQLWRVGSLTRPLLKDPEFAVFVGVATPLIMWALRGHKPDEAVTKWWSMRQTELERNAYARRGEMSEEENERRLYEEREALSLEAEDRRRRNVHPYNSGESWRSLLQLRQSEEDRRRRSRTRHPGVN